MTCMTGFRRMGEVGTVETIVVSLETHLLGVRVRAHLWIVSLHASVPPPPTATASTRSL